MQSRLAALYFEYSLWETIFTSEENLDSAVDWVCVSSQIHYVETLITFERSWRWSPCDGISALIRGGSRELLLSLPPPMWGYHEKAAIYMPGGGPRQNPTMQAPSSRASSLQNWEVNFCCWSHPVYRVLLFQSRLRQTLKATVCVYISNTSSKDESCNIAATVIFTP